MRWPERFGRMPVIPILCLILLLLTGCRAVDTSGQGWDWPARLRVVNASQARLSDIVVIFPNQRLLYGALAAGATSDYQPAPRGVYAYAALQLTIDGERRSFPVIDFTGEEPLGPGSYSLILTFDPQHPDPWQQLQHKIIADR